jgi:beta-N-acetylhexosaminidase
MIGQMLVMGFHGLSLNDQGCQQIKQDIHQGLVGGVLVFRYNIETPTTLAALTSALKSAVQGPDPLLVSMDQEGGAVQKLDARYGYPAFPRALAYGQLDQAERVRISQQIAQGLRDVGVNLNFAPVVDLHDEQSKIIGHYGRAFSRDPAHVARCAQDFIAGHHEVGVLTCIKHFPGHGLALGDSHHGLVDISATTHPDELSVYERMINKTPVDMIMTGHLWNCNVDEERPATLSSTYINGLLRQQLGYQGVVISDDLHMGAILQKYSLERAVILAIQAGCDLLIVSQNPASAGGVDNFKPDPLLPEKIHQIIRAAIDAGELALSQIEAAYERIKALKGRLG